MLQSQSKKGFEMFKDNNVSGSKASKTYKGDYILTSRELFIESQKPHLKLILDSIDWENLNSSGNGMVMSSDSMESNVSNKFQRYYYSGDFDVLDTSCIKKGCHTESIHHLPSYMVCGDYGKFVIDMIRGKKFNRNTGYPNLDSTYPDSIKIKVMARISNVDIGEKSVLFYGERPVQPVEQSQMELYKQINEIIKDNQLPLRVRVYNDVVKKRAEILIYSTEENFKEMYIFKFCFSLIESLEIVIADGLQIDSRKL
jgi:hypothetical protein